MRSNPSALPPNRFQGRFRAMLQARLYLDYMDPGSLLVDRRLRRLEKSLDVEILRLPYEVRRPPEPLLDPSDPAWSDYWDSVAGEARTEGLELQPLRLIPWTRKAHELALHAREQSAFQAVHDALFAAVHLEGRDVGRVDVLVELARAAGLDHSETKAALDVDRYAETVDEIRAHARKRGVRGVPTLVTSDRTLEGIHPTRVLNAFMDGREKE